MSLRSMSIPTLSARGVTSGTGVSTASPNSKRRLVRHDSWAQAVPTFIIDGRYVVQGAQPAASLIDALTEVARVKDETP